MQKEIFPVFIYFFKRIYLQYGHIPGQISTDIELE